MRRLPEPLKAVVDQFARLPGFGPKSALRAAMMLLKWPEAETRRLGKAVFELRDNLNLCSRCGAPADEAPCAICRDEARRRDLLCVTADWDSQLTLEEGGFYRGQYLILGGLLAPLDNMHADSLDLDRLMDRLAEGETAEIILALGTMVEAESTASFLKSKVLARFPNMRISRLAQGIPLGSEVKHMDRETLRQSLQFRQNLS